MLVYELFFLMGRFGRLGILQILRIMTVVKFSKDSLKHEVLFFFFFLSFSGGVKMTDDSWCSQVCH